MVCCTGGGDEKKIYRISKKTKKGIPDTVLVFKVEQRKIDKKKGVRKWRKTKKKDTTLGTY